MFSLNIINESIILINLFYYEKKVTICYNNIRSVSHLFLSSLGSRLEMERYISQRYSCWETRELLSI